MQIEIASDLIYYPRESTESRIKTYAELIRKFKQITWQLSYLSTSLFKKPKSCSQTKLMDSTDIFNKPAVNCELSQAEVLFPYAAKRCSQQAMIR